MVTNARRRQLFELARESWGEEGAETLMELLPPVGWSDVARQSDLAELRGEMAELRGEMAELRAELRGEMAELRGELRGEMAELRAELRGEVTELRAELRGEARATLAKVVAANIASMVGVSGLVLAAGALL